MKQQIYAELNAEERIIALEGNNDGISKEKYKRKFSGSERNQRRSRYIDIDKEIADLNAELDEMKQRIKERKDPLVKEKNKIFEELMQGGVTVEGRLFKVVDEDAKEVGFYDEDGQLVSQRGMDIEERQKYLHFGTVAMSMAE